VCLGNPFGLAIHPTTGELFFADSDNHLVRKIDSEGQVVTVAGDGSGGYQGDGGPAIDASFFYPRRPAFDPAGNLYVADYHNRLVRKIAPAGTWDYARGTITTAAGAPPGVSPLLDEGSFAAQVPMGRPESLAVDGAGNLYIAQVLLDFRFEWEGAREGVVWRLNEDLGVTPVTPLSRSSLVADLRVDAPEPTFARVTVQLIDRYGRRGQRIEGVSRALGNHDERQRELIVDLRAEMGQLSAQGIEPDRIRVEARGKGGRWMSRDVPIP
jgi:hypothetical protein